MQKRMKVVCGIAAVVILLSAAVRAAYLLVPSLHRTIPMEGSGPAELDPAGLMQAVRVIERLEEDTPLYVSADNFELFFTPDFAWKDAGAIRFFYQKGDGTRSAQLRLFHEEGSCFVTESDPWQPQEQMFSLQGYLEALKYLPKEEIRRLTPDSDQYSVLLCPEGVPEDFERTITYTPGGAGDIDGWYIHLVLSPWHEENGAYTGSAEELVHLFYGEP